MVTYPPSAFHFRVSFAGIRTSEDASFQEVSGIGTKIETEEVREGGENAFVHMLPKKVTHTNLVLKRGIASIDSELVTWCQDTAVGGLFDIRPKLVHVHLLDAKQTTLHGWTFANAYPVRWELGAFNSQENKVAVETIELAYAYWMREI
ncbi:MAG: phage tail protein [Betaproteobacteria bacterium]|nr:phage tail protein [Betaproteobacteria bacterium]